MVASSWALRSWNARLALRRPRLLLVLVMVDVVGDGEGEE